jgi:hypothetical protein
MSGLEGSVAKHRRVGPLGEDVLQKWASEEDATLNKAHKDQGGWDFILEFPVKHRLPRREPDREETSYQCLIQVKSTDSLQQHRSVKISNWKRLVETPLPAFFLALHFDGKIYCQKAFLVHVWEEEIARVLRKVREYGVNGEGDRLHKHTLALKWREADHLGELTGESLLERIAEIIGTSPADYSCKKLKLRHSVGYDDANIQVTTRIIVPPEYRKRHPDELLVDSILGLVPQLELVGGEIRDIRFGIPSSSHTEIGKGAKLKLGPGKNVFSGHLVFRTPDRSREVSLPTALFTPGGSRTRWDPSAQKVLFKLPYAECILPVNGGNMMINFNLPKWEDQISLSKATDLASLLKFMQDMRSTRDSEPVNMWLDDQQIGTMTTHQVDLPREALEWAKLVILANDVVTQLSLPLDLKTTIKSIKVQQNALMLIHAARGDCVAHNLTFTFSLEEGAPPKRDEQMCFPVHIQIKLGGKRLVIFESLIGIPKEERTETGEYVVPIHRAEIETILRLGSDELLPKKREQYLDEVAQARAQEGGVLCWWQSKEKTLK